MVAAGCVAPGPDPTPPPVQDRSVVALDIVPSGSFSPPYAGDVGVEARMYDSLTPLGKAVGDADVAKGFKSARLGFPEGEKAISTERPKAGVLIRRDRFNVPYVTADTDAKAIWAVGWVSASHAPLEYEVARRNGRLAVLDVPGVSSVWTSFGLQWLEPSGATESVLARQIDVLRAQGERGLAVLADIDSWVSGYNARLDATLSPLPRWTRRDVVALAAFKSDWFGRGRTDWAGPPLGPTDPLAVPTPTDASAQSLNSAADVPPSAAPERDEHGMEPYQADRAALASNFALVSGARSSTGHPLIIGGPQVGYMYPAVAFEIDIHSPSIHMRGLTAPSFPGYVFVGRGEDFAWTLNVAPVTTSVAMSVPMCGDMENSYLVGGECRPVERFTVGRMRDFNNLLGTPTKVTMRRTIYGPLERVIDSDGTRVGVVLVRPASGHDVLDMVGYRAVNYGHTRGPDQFRTTMQTSPQAFNFGYVDAGHIAAFQTCWCMDPATLTEPVTNPGDFVIASDTLPTTVDTPNGVITNWNEPLNTVDGEFVPPASGELRNDWYEAFNSVPVHTPTSLVASMNDIATRDTSGGVSSFFDIFPPMPGSRPPQIMTTDRSTAIQIVMSFD
jgi:hypothetical protein